MKSLIIRSQNQPLEIMHCFWLKEGKLTRKIWRKCHTGNFADVSNTRAQCRGNSERRSDHREENNQGKKTKEGRTESLERCAKHETVGCIPRSAQETETFSRNKKAKAKHWVRQRHYSCMERQGVGLCEMTSSFFLKKKKKKKTKKTKKTKIKQ